MLSSVLQSDDGGMGVEGEGEREEEEREADDDDSIITQPNTDIPRLHIRYIYVLEQSQPLSYEL